MLGGGSSEGNPTFRREVTRAGVTHMLTDKAVRNAKPTAKPVRLTDERGLYLEVAPSGG